MEKHIKIIGGLWIALGILGFLWAFFAFALMFGISFIPEVEAPFLLRGIGFWLGLVIFIMSLPEIVAGIFLIKKREWARVFTLVLAFLALLNFPLGTALGVYTLMILFKPETAQLFSSGPGT